MDLANQVKEEEHIVKNIFNLSQQNLLRDKSLFFYDIIF